jgi:signal transduction histidine kinase
MTSPPARRSVRLNWRLRRTVRARLTALYGSLFLASGVGLLTLMLLLQSRNGVNRPGLVPIQPTTDPNVTGHPLTPMAQPIISLHEFVVESGIALTIMALVSVALGWIVAGRVLRPLRTMTATTRRISEHSLHRRLALPGPADELKELGDTIDGLLARLEGAFEAQRSFVAHASHELRTPLTVSRAMLQVALADPALTLDSLRSTCIDVLAVGDEQEQLIEALLVLARSQRGLDKWERFDLAQITREVLAGLAPEAERYGVTVESATSPAALSGDARLVERLVSNLVGNALRYNVPHGRAQVTVDSPAGQALLKVTNTGPVIPTTQIDRLTQPFQRLGTDRTASPDGLGLGLSIVAAVTTAHKATLVIHPGPEGGLDIRVCFPPARETRPAAAWVRPVYAAGR